MAFSPDSGAPQPGAFFCVIVVDVFVVVVLVVVLDVVMYSSPFSS